MLYIIKERYTPILKGVLLMENSKEQIIDLVNKIQDPNLINYILNIILHLKD